MDPLRKATAASGIYDDIAAAEKHATGKDNGVGAADGEVEASLEAPASVDGGTYEGGPLPLGWQLADRGKAASEPGWDNFLGRVSTSDRNADSCCAGDGRLPAAAGDTSIAAAPFWLLFRDAAKEQRFCHSRSSCLRPVRLDKQNMCWSASTYCRWL